MRNTGTRLTILAALVLTLIPLSAPITPVSAATDSLITSLVLTEAEAVALGLEFKSIDDSSSPADYVVAQYVDASLGYDINLTVTLKPCTSTDSISLASMTSGCTNCSEPGCQERELSNGDRMPNGPCFSAYRNGYTNFGFTVGETVFAQGDVLVRIESSKGSGRVKTLQDYQDTLSRHNWFVQQVVAKLDAGYQADMMHLTAYGSIEPVTTGALTGQDGVFVKGTLTGPTGGMAGVKLEGYYFSPSGSGWNYLGITDASGNFSLFMGAVDEIARVTIKARHTDTSPAYAGTVPISITDFTGQPAVANTGMSVSISTDKAVYSAGDTMVIQGSVADAQGGLPDATVIVNVNGAIVTAALDSAGRFQFTHTLPPGIADGTYTITALVSMRTTHVTGHDVRVGDMKIVLSRTP